MGWNENRVMRVKEAKEKLETCNHCGLCESRCPYHLPIQELLPKSMESLWEHMENLTIPNI
jgi:predicted aldo/keto reductase-like oxidoreductase